MPGMTANLFPFRAFFNYGKSEKLQGAKSGEYGSWSIFVMDFLAKNFANS
jgi:hypothetical protein